MPQRTAFETDTGSPLSEAIAERDRDTVALVGQALAARRVMLAFQPVVYARRPERAAYYEGLVRVTDPQGRIIPAAEFITTVETHELGRQLDCHALDIGLTTLARVPDLRLSINMSARSIGYPRWREILRSGLARRADIGERLILEITESSAMLMPDLVGVFMKDLQTRGVSFALDDFGAGYTAFRYLRDLCFDILKIDGQFIRGIATDADNQVVTEALVSLARHFDMFTVAECVQSDADARFLGAAGLDCLQGHLFGAPTIRPHWLPQHPAQRAG